MHGFRVLFRGVHAAAHAVDACFDIAPAPEHALLGLLPKAQLRVTEPALPPLGVAGLCLLSSLRRCWLYPDSNAAKLGVYYRQSRDQGPYHNIDDDGDRFRVRPCAGQHHAYARRIVLDVPQRSAKRLIPQQP